MPISSARRRRPKEPAGEAIYRLGSADLKLPKLFALSEGQRGMVAGPEDKELDWMSLLRGEHSPSEPIRFRHHVGRVPRDLMHGGTPHLLLISDRFLGVLRAHDFSGWTTYPVEVRRKRGDLIPGYSGLVITGRSRHIANFEAALAEHGIEELARRSWAGFDLYLDGGGALVVVTERVRDAIRAAKLTNVHFMSVP